MNDPAAEAWSWPPPGLERLRGVLRTVARRGTLATVLAGGALTWIVTARQNLTDGAAGAVLGFAIVLGTLAYLGAILRAAAALDLARRARRLGYGRDVVLDVLADPHPDTGALVNGTGEYAELRPRLRHTVRRLRRWSAGVAALAGLLPLPILCLGIVLALRGAAARLSVVLLLLAPLVLLGLAALTLRGYAALLLQWEKGAAAWDPSPVTERDRAREWQASFDRAEPVRSGGLLPIVALAAAGIFCFVFVFVTASGVSVLGSVTGDATRTRIAEQLPELMRVELLRAGRVPVDSTLPLDSADRALHAYLTAAGDWFPGMKSPLPEHPPLWTGGRPLPASPRVLWRMVLGDSATAPLPELRDPAPHPALAELALLARAPALDPVRARWEGPPPTGEFGSFYDREPSFRAAALRPVRDAAAALRNGEPARARVILRDLLSAGLLLVDHGRTPGQLHLGRLMAEAGGELLLELEGGAAAEAYRAAGDVAFRTTRRTGGAGAGVLPDDALLRRVLDPQLYPALRWDALRQLQQRTRCGAPGALLFADAGGLERLHRQARTALVSAPGDSLAFLALTQPTPVSFEGASRWHRRIRRMAGAAGGRALLENPCFNAFMLRF